MAEYWQAVHIRGQQSIGVWGTFSAAFQVGSVTVLECDLGAPGSLCFQATCRRSGHADKSAIRKAMTSHRTPNARCRDRLVVQEPEPRCAGVVQVPGQSLPGLTWDDGHGNRDTSRFGFRSLAGAARDSSSQRIGESPKATRLCAGRFVIRYFSDLQATRTTRRSSKWGGLSELSPFIPRSVSESHL